MGLDYVYLVFDIFIEKVVDIIKVIKIFNLCGVNVIMFCKSEVLKYMDDFFFVVWMIGVVNIIVNEDGKLIGYIIDGFGFIVNLWDVSVDVIGKKMIIIGVGGVVIVI